jgi:putative component of toxin-antitoxin plasmid stabilization module
MLDVQLTEAFKKWLDQLDTTVRRRIATRLRKLQAGLW